MAEFKDRLDQALSMRNMKPADLAKLTGIGEGAISQYRKGAYKASQRNLDIMSKKLEVSIPWLMGISDEIGRPLPANVLPMPKTYKVPLLGTIACGKPILCVEDADETVDVPEWIHADFALKCKGDSMINARIFSGDVVYIRSQPEVENGEIAAVRIGDDATLKKVYYSGGRISLRAANPTFPDMDYEGDTLNQIEVLGKAVGFSSLIQQ